LDAASTGFDEECTPPFPWCAVTLADPRAGNHCEAPRESVRRERVLRRAREERLDRNHRRRRSVRANLSISLSLRGYMDKRLDDFKAYVDMRFDAVEKRMYGERRA
jgi:hypothetical protein